VVISLFLAWLTLDCNARTWLSPLQNHIRHYASFEMIETFVVHSWPYSLKGHPNDVLTLCLPPLIFTRLCCSHSHFTLGLYSLPTFLSWRLVEQHFSHLGFVFGIGSSLGRWLWKFVFEKETKGSRNILDSMPSIKPFLQA